MKSFTLLLLVLASACTSPSKYAPKKEKYGYTDEIIDPHLRLVTFPKAVCPVKAMTTIRKIFIFILPLQGTSEQEA